MARPVSRWFALASLLIALLALPACGAAAATALQTATTTGYPAASGMPPCPAAGQARAARMPALPAGAGQHVVYYANQGNDDHPGSSVLRRYDVARHQATDILQLPHGIITDASVEGPWILFVLRLSPAETALQLIRLDGQDYQTLHCFARQQADGYGIFALAWSPDSKLAAFNEGNYPYDAPVKLLDLTTGHLQTEVLAPGRIPTSEGGSLGASPTKWLDNAHLALTGMFSTVGTGALGVYLLDTAQGANQTLSRISKVATNAGVCFDEDNTPDGRTLYLSTCSLASGDNFGFQGPSTVQSQPATGGSPTPVYTSPALAVISVRCHLADTDAAGGDQWQRGSVPKRPLEHAY